MECLGEFAMLYPRGGNLITVSANFGGSERGKSLQQSRDSEWGTLPQRRISTACGLIKREIVG